MFHRADVVTPDCPTLFESQPSLAASYRISLTTMSMAASSISAAASSLAWIYVAGSVHPMHTNHYGKPSTKLPLHGGFKLMAIVTAGSKAQTAQHPCQTDALLQWHPWAFHATDSWLAWLFLLHEWLEHAGYPFDFVKQLIGWFLLCLTGLHKTLES